MNQSSVVEEKRSVVEMRQNLVFQILVKITFLSSASQILSILANVYIIHGIVGYTQTIDLLRKSANLVHVPRGDWIKLWC